MQHVIQICFAEEAKKEANPLNDLQALIEARIEDIKKFYNENVDADKIKQFTDRLAEHGKKFVTDAKTDFDTIQAKTN